MSFMERLHSALILKTPLYHPNEAHIIEQPHRRFLDAIRQGDRKSVETQILEGFDVDHNECTHTPALTWAIVNDRFEIVQTLLSYGADVNVHDHKNVTPLHAAVKMHQEETLHLLMRYGARPDTPDNEGVTPLHLAKESGERGLVRILENTAPMATSEFSLFEAAQRGDLLSIARNDRGGDRLFARNDQGQTLLHPAVQSNNLKLVVYLLNKGLDIDAADSMGNTPLCLISYQSGQSGMMRYLIRRHATLNHRNDQRQSALLIALRYGHVDYVDILLDAGADIHTSDGLATPLTLCHKALEFFPEFAERFRQIETRLLIKGAHVDIATNELGWSPLLQCITRSKETGIDDEFDLLIKLGADVNHHDANGRTAMMIAASTGRVTYVERLMKNYADPDLIDNYGWSALMFAVYYNHSRIVKMLLEYGADVNATSAKGLTALKIATQYERTRLITLLRDHGATTEDENRE